MKKNRLFLIAALATATFTLLSCINDEYNPEVVRLAVNSLGSSVTTRADGATDVTQLQNTQFISGERIYVETYLTGTATAHNSGVFTTTSTVAALGGIELNGPATPLYYPPSTNIDILAYYPSDASAAAYQVTSSLASFTVKTDQTALPDYRISDLMYAAKETNLDKSSRHGLTFHHALSQVIVTIEPATSGGLTASDVNTNVTAVKINNTKTTAALSHGTAAGLKTGVITMGALSNVADISIKGTVANNVGIVIPQSVTGTDDGSGDPNLPLITVTYTDPTTGAHDYSYMIGSGTTVTFEAGKTYTFNLKLKLSGIELNSIEITDWQNGTGSPTNVPDITL